MRDHVGGIAELKQKYNCRVVAPARQGDRDRQCRSARGHGDVVKVGIAAGARARDARPHARPHLATCSTTRRSLFAADTLFSIGCGRVFEGTYPMMWDSLLKLRALPDDFKLYCGHEYTASNVKFALTIEPDNPALKARAEEVDAAARGRASRRCRRCSARRRRPTCSCAPTMPSVAAGVRHEGQASAADVFGELRERKNKS